MTPGARVSAAIEVLDRVFDGMPAEQALTRWARGARYAGSKDRAAVRDHVFQALRCRRSYGSLGGGEAGRAVMIGALRSEGTDPAALFTGEGHSPATLTQTEANGASCDMSEAETADLPDWLWHVFQEDLGADAMSVAQAQRVRAPISLRVNKKVNSVSQAIEKLLKEDIGVRSVSDSDTALIVTLNARKVQRSAAFLDGAVELQDVSSQAAMARVIVPSAAKVLDYCAGGGGKTLALACNGDIDTGVQFFAHDADPGRMVDLPKRAARAGVQVACLETNNLTAHAPFDLVLCDVPCSGSGTWRRGPEAKWRLTHKRLEELIEIQRDILRAASDLVRVGGQLVYTTCSVLVRENEAQIERFCKARPAFGVTDQARWPVSDIGDGFFFAEMRREN